MTTDEELPADDEGSNVKICFLHEGNDTEFPYELSIHGAWMLQQGIEEYARQSTQMHDSGEDVSYCQMMIGTAIKQAEQLRAWAVQADPDYLSGMIRGLDRLLKELAAQRDRYAALESREKTSEATSSGVSLMDQLFGKQTDDTKDERP